MTHYIDKSALAAEIKKLIKRYKTFQPHSSYEDGLKEGRLIGYEDALCKINTLEVKEANSTDTFIEKAVEWLKSNLYDYAGEDDMGSIVPFDSSIFEDFKNYMKGE